MRGNIWVLLGSGVATLAATCFGATCSVDSPDRKIQATVEDGAQLTFTLTVDGRTVLDKRPIGLETEAGAFGRNATALSNESGVKRKTILSRPITVERKVHHVN